MQKDELFRRMDARLRRLDFAELWPGFRRYPCALYDREGVCLEGENLPPEKDWFANTAVCFRGKWTAIWNVEVDPPGEDMDLFTANLVHEMFHCYQYEMGESRWPDEREMLLYPMEEGNLRARRQELRLLARGAAEEDRAAFEAFRGNAAIAEKALAPGGGDGIPGGMRRGRGGIRGPESAGSPGSGGGGGKNHPICPGTGRGGGKAPRPQADGVCVRVSAAEMRGTIRRGNGAFPSYGKAVF